MTERFLHGNFWDQYSQAWDQEVRPQIEGQILGEEWTSPERTEFVYRNFAEPFCDRQSKVVEIGPGGGKFSRRLVERCAELTLVDISADMLRRAGEACGGRARILHVEDGRLTALDSDSIDLVFSFDVFIHLESEEVFRYFAEVNRVLRGGGIFSVHTSTFESRWGFHSYLQQFRDNSASIGSRYGGRMYPMSDGIVRRFIEHSGFEVVTSYSSRQDKDLIYVLRKVGPARVWDFVVNTPELSSRIELSERLGGSSQRELFSGLDIAAGKRVVFLLGDAGDPVLVSIAATEPPKAPGLLADGQFLEHGSFALASFPCQLPWTFDAWLEQDRGEKAADPNTLLAQFAEALLLTHDQGLVHGELNPGSVIWDEADDVLCLVGLYPAEEAAEELRLSDLRGLGRLLARAGVASDDEPLGQLLEELEESPSRETAEEMIAQLRDN